MCCVVSLTLGLDICNNGFGDGGGVTFICSFICSSQYENRYSVKSNHLSDLTSREIRIFDEMCTSAESNNRNRPYLESFLGLFPLWKT